MSDLHGQSTPPDRPGTWVRQRGDYAEIFPLDDTLHSKISDEPVMKYHKPGDWWTFVPPLPPRPKPPRRFVWRDSYGHLCYGLDCPITGDLILIQHSGMISSGNKCKELNIVEWLDPEDQA